MHYRELSLALPCLLRVKERLIHIGTDVLIQIDSLSLNFSIVSFDAHFTNFYQDSFEGKSGKSILNLDKRAGCECKTCYGGGGCNGKCEFISCGICLTISIFLFQDQHKLP